MKMKTSELTAPALDWAVGEIEFNRLVAQGSHVKQWVLDDHVKGLRTDPYSTNWSLAGPIIEREGIGLDYYPDGGHPQGGEWGALTNEGTVESFGPTPLVAAMRCYVASKLGDEANVPEGLI